MKKIVSLVLSLTLCTSLMVGCGGKKSGDTASTDTTKGNSTEISVISREEGSGTRGAFIELFGVEKKDDSGKKIDHTTDEANVTNNTSVMMTTVAGNKDAIGYISLGSLNDTVKALKIDGVEATADNIKSGTYKIARPFNIATKDKVSEVAQDFIDYIMSKDGQAIVGKNGYIPMDTDKNYEGKKPSGKVVVAGSSSVTPVMEKLKEAYVAINANANIEIQQSDSTTGMKSAIEGICDIGMASRGLKDSEKGAGLKNTVIAQDGIAVIVNKENKLSEIKSEDVMKIFTGVHKTWDKVSK
ncbi:phosphate ABC transporter substrate-binding protein, PhoT family (TC 3.A.1.7.1) [Hathewaya proteolytica DSM 3090]|uniref:Phosphate ABC transporter substrate-binding protein, PhoT family (TC 3.A.1.7.1) n=1 Tax=Hathewaya proteolytica DSM 3090 TaxID=1121331 RepID=A0A1M6PVV9_9CLOT|nr:substrate-binding domain-containing protein [Hathewaya proteolytica]SHK12051.1 phosphate ABC transporter substrate-binding protein, PhoT family (TC 3.A.1.7.1) [Hathewaya proteolytica DSM 3090]